MEEKMEVKKDKRARTKKRGLDRFIIQTHKEYAAGLLPQREYTQTDAKTPFTTRGEAAAFEKILRERIAGGATGPQDKTFEDALEHWVSRFTDKVGQNTSRQTHLNSSISRARNHLLRLQLNGVDLGQVRLSEINEELLFAELFKDRGPFYKTMNAHSSRSNLLSIFKKIFELAVAQKWIPRSPAATLELASVKQVDDPEAKQIDPALYAKLGDDIPKIFSALEIINPESLGVFQFYRRTGMRTGELRALCVSQLNQGDQVCKIKVDRTFKNKDSCLGLPKNGKTRYSSIAAAFANEIRVAALANPVVDLEIELSEDNRVAIKDKFVFGDRDGRPASYTALSTTWRQVQFAVAGWGFFRNTSAKGAGRSYTLVKLPKPIDQFTIEEWKSFKLGQKGLKKGAPRPGVTTFTTVAEAAAEIGLKLFGLHDFRHLFASSLAAAGVSDAECAARIGDDIETFKKHYLHCFPQDESEDLRAIEAIG